MYKITKNTIALINDQSQYYGTKIIAKNHPEEKCVDESILQLLEYNCLEYGSALSGRHAYSEKVLQENYNLPICLHPKNGIFFFPTKSIYKPGCILLSFYHVINYIGEGALTAVELSNKQTLFINTTYNQFDRQIKRTSQVIAKSYGMFR